MLQCDIRYGYNYDPSYDEEDTCERMIIVLRCLSYKSGEPA